MAMINLNTFHNEYERLIASLNRPGWENLQQLLLFIQSDEEMKDERFRAYLLGTVWHETGATFAPIVERGAASYFNKYEPARTLGKRLGNTQPGDGLLFRGRGYVQITGRANYARLGTLLGVDLIAQPNLALDPVISYQIASRGMRQGLFTGRKLAHYFTANIEDWVHARQIINSLDRAELIAAVAQRFQTILQHSVS